MGSAEIKAEEKKDIGKIKSETEELTKVVQEATQEMYQKVAEEQAKNARYMSFFIRFLWKA